MKINKKKYNHLNQGLSHWKMQRLSAILILPLVIWFLFSVLAVMFSTYSETIEWFMSPINSFLLVILLAGMFYHSAMGLQVVIEDYITNIKIRNIIINISKVFLSVLSLVSIISILKIIFF